jgi:hypothetical protein
VFAEDLIGRLSHVANFDMTKNGDEINEKLRSMYDPAAEEEKKTK